MKYSSHLIFKISESQFWYGFITAGFSAVLSFMAPIWSFVFMAFILVIVDMITGIRAARVRGEKIKSRGLFRGVEKFAMYFLAITVAEQMRVTFFPVIPITHIVSSGICVTEFFSMVENVEAVTGVNILRRIKKALPLPEEE